MRSPVNIPYYDTTVPPNKVPQCLSPRRKWDPPPTPSPSSDCAPPSGTGEACTHLQVRGWGSPNSDDWRKKSSTLSTLWCRLCFVIQLGRFFFKESSLVLSENACLILESCLRGEKSPIGFSKAHSSQRIHYTWAVQCSTLGYKRHRIKNSWMDKRLSCWLYFRCCCTTVDFATAALQNEFRISLFLQKKTDSFKKMTKLLDF